MVRVVRGGSSYVEVEALIYERVVGIERSRS